MSKPGVALLGLDHWYAALNLAAVAARADECRLVGVSHHDEAKAHQVAREHGADVATADYHTLLARDDVDVVVAMYSTEQNVPVCRAAAAAGKHIIGVKPMAMDLAGADAIVEAVRDAGVMYLPFESSHRLMSKNQQIKRWIDEGRIGQPQRYMQMLHCSLPQAWPGSQSSGWWIDPARVPGGGWIDHGIYAVDLVRWLFGVTPGEVLGVVARRRQPALPVEDYGLATYTLSNGAIAIIEDTWTAEQGFFFSRSEVVGSAGAILDETQTTGRIVVRGDFGFDAWMALEQQRSAADTVLDHMLACIRETCVPIATAEDGRANLAACLAFYQAARSGAVVRLNPTAV